MEKVFFFSWKLEQHDDLKKKTRDKTLEITSVKTVINTKLPTYDDNVVFTENSLGDENSFIHRHIQETQVAYGGRSW
jgi:hypothetical protein